VASFYEHLRWPGWQEETAALKLDQGFKVDPPPFTREGRIIGDAAHKPAKMTALWKRQQDFIKEFGA
jgi:hypothetical protein